MIGDISNVKICHQCGEAFSDYFGMKRNKDHYQCETRDKHFCGAPCLSLYEAEQKREVLGW
jgi:hypothetical protein